MNSRYDPETGCAVQLPGIVLECPIHGECAECAQLAETIEAQARGRAEAMAEVRKVLQASIDEWHAIAKDDPGIEYYHQQADELIRLRDQLLEAGQ